MINKKFIELTSKKVGESFSYNKIKYIITENNDKLTSCELCDLKEKCYLAKCSPQGREDKKDVYYKSLD